MAPNASDPNEFRLALNPARRKALVNLVGIIVSQMRSTLEKSFEATTADQIAPLFHNSGYDRPSGSTQQEQIRQLQEETPSLDQKLVALRADALANFNRWSREVRDLLRKVCEGPEDALAEQRRREWSSARKTTAPTRLHDAEGFTNTRKGIDEDATKFSEEEEVSLTQSLYHPIATRLTTISKEDRICAVSCMILAVLSLKHYSAHSRVLLCHLTSSLNLPLSVLITEEREIAVTLMQASKALSADGETK